MEIYLLRHGVTDWNNAYKIQGSSDIPLNELGEEMARQTGEYFRKEGIEFDVVYSSPLKRAYRSSELVANGAEIITDERLKEMSFGSQEGRVVMEIAKSDLPFKYFKKEPLKYDEAVKGYDDKSESFVELLARSKSFLDEIVEGKLATGGDWRVLISAHGALDQALIYHMKGRENVDEFWSGGLLPNCGIDIIEYDAKTRRYTFKEEMLYFYDKELFEKVPRLLK